MVEISDSEKTRIRALAISVVRSIAEQHGGVTERGLQTDVVVVSVPEGQRAVCAQEIVEQLGAMREYFLTLLLPLLVGKVIVRISNN
jgi:hypothetical protein